MFPSRVLLLAIPALLLWGCGPRTDSTDPAASTGFIAPWRQFLELDSAPPSSNPSPASNPGTVAPETTSSEAPANRPSSGGAGLSAEIEQFNTQIRSLYGDAGTYIDGFPQAEDIYRNIPKKFAEQVEKIKENKANADPDTIRRRLTQMSAQVGEMVARQHTRFSTLRDTFTQRMDALMKRSAEFERACAKKRGSDDETKACTTFQDALSMMKTKGDLVKSGFDHLDDVYKETVKQQTELSAQTAAAAGK